MTSREVLRAIESSRFCRVIRQRGSHKFVRCECDGQVCTTVVPDHRGVELGWSTALDRKGSRTVPRQEVAPTMKTEDAYKVVYRRDDNDSWFVKTPQVQGAHSHGRTLAAARRNIREAIALVLDIDDDKSFRLEEDFRLRDPKVQAAIKKARMLRDSAAEMDSAVQAATEDALSVALDPKTGLSLRDLGELLGLSFQRVQQLATKLKDTA